MIIEIAKTILLVEDEAVTAAAQARSLEKNGFNVITAYNGEKAVECATGNSKIDLILMDIDLGAGMDGTQAAAIILIHRDIPLLFLSSHTEPEIVERTEKITSYGYVVKNTGETVLMASIKMAFKLHEANMKLRITGDNFSTVFHMNPVAMSISRISNCIVCDVNEAFSKLMGFQGDEVIGKNVMEDLSVWVDPGDKHLIVEEVERRGRVDSFERLFRMKDGTLRMLEISAELIMYDNEVSLLIIWHDFTERRRAEELLRESEERYRTLFENATEGIFLTTPAGRYIAVNPSTARMFRYSSPEEMIDSVTDIGLQIYANPEDRFTVQRMLAEHGKFEGLEVEMVRKDKSRIWITMNIHVVRDKQGNILYYDGTCVDITERKRAEELLRESEERYRMLFENATEGLFLTTPAGKYINVNPSVARMFGYSSPREVLETVSDIGRQIYAHPEDRDTFLRMMAEHGKVEGFEVEMVRKDSSRIWIRMNVHVVRDAQGNIMHYEGTCVDITESRRIEDALRKSENEFKTLFEAGPIGIGLLKGRVILKANTQLIKMTGYTAEEMLGQFVQKFYASDDEFERVGRILYGMIEKDGLGEMETRLADKSGRFVDIILRGSAIDRNDPSSGTIITVQDITERKRSEEALEKALQEKETLFHELQHRMKNSLMMINSILLIEIEHSDDNNTRAVLENIKGRIESLAFLYTLLYNSKSLREVSLDEYIDSIVASLASSYISVKTPVTIEKKCDRITADVKSAAAWGLIVNELLTNALKYAYPMGESGVISIRLGRKNSLIELAVSDRGAGPAADFDIDNPRGLGLLLVRLLAGQLGGRLSFRRSEENVFMVIAPA